MNIIKPFLILELNLNSAEDEAEVLSALKVPYLRVMGSYKGVVSRAYLFPLTSSSHGDETFDLIELAREYNQESILIVDANGMSSLYFIADGTEVMLGKWGEIDSLTAQTLDAWTQIGTQYFAAIGA